MLRYDLDRIIEHLNLFQMKQVAFMLTAILMLSAVQISFAKISMHFENNKLLVSTDAIGVQGLRGCESSTAKPVSAYVYELQESTNPVLGTCSVGKFKGWRTLRKLESNKPKVVFNKIQEGSYRVIVHSGKAIGCIIDEPVANLPSKSIVYEFEESEIYNTWNPPSENNSDKTQSIVYIDGMQIYPNPSEGNINILIRNSLLKTNAMLVIYDIIGNEIEQKEFDIPDSSDHSWNLNIGHYSAGTYLVKVFDELGHFYEEKVIVQKQ